MNHFGHLSFATRSEVGLKRSNNEDSYGSFPAHGFWCVADGMGGGDDGEIASAAVVRELERLFDANPMPQDGAYSGETVAAAVEDAVNSASEWIFRRAQERKRRGCGSTFVGVVFDATRPKEAIALHAGDSRLYRIRGRDIKQITKDHSAAELVGVKHESDLNPMFRGMILRAVGIQPDVSIQRTPFHVKNGDVVLVCSDGLSRMVPDKRIAEIINAGGGVPSRMADGLIKAAYDAGAVDNVTVEVICVGPLPAAAASVAFVSDGGLSDVADRSSDTSETEDADEGASTQDTSVSPEGSCCERASTGNGIPASVMAEGGLERRWRLLACVSVAVTLALLVILAVVLLLWVKKGQREENPPSVAPTEILNKSSRERDVAVPAEFEHQQVKSAIDEHPTRPSAVINPPLPSSQSNSVAETVVNTSLPGKGTTVPHLRANMAKVSENQEQETLAARLEAARAAQQQAESDARALQEMIHAAAKNLKKECSGETCPKFINRLKASFGSSRCVYIKNSADDLKCLNGSDEDKIDTLALAFVQELQKFYSPTDDVAKAVMPMGKMRELSEALSGSEPKIREACILAVEIIREVAAKEGGNGGFKR